MDEIARLIAARSAGEQPWLPGVVQGLAQLVKSAIVQHRQAALRGRLAAAAASAMELAAMLGDPDFLLAMPQSQPEMTPEVLADLAARLRAVAAGAASTAAAMPVADLTAPAPPHPRLLCAAAISTAWRRCHDGEPPDVADPDASRAADALWLAAGGEAIAASDSVWPTWFERTREGG